MPFASLFLSLQLLLSISVATPEKAALTSCDISYYYFRRIPPELLPIFVTPSPPPESHFLTQHCAFHFFFPTKTEPISATVSGSLLLSRSELELDFRCWSAVKVKLWLRKWFQFPHLPKEKVGHTEILESLLFLPLQYMNLKKNINQSPCNRLVYEDRKKIVCATAELRNSVDHHSRITNTEQPRSLARPRFWCLSPCAFP